MNARKSAAHASESRLKAAPAAEFGIDHLSEIEALTSNCIQTAIELLPGFCDGRTEESRTELGIHLLVHLRAIEMELKMFRGDS